MDAFFTYNGNKCYMRVVGFLYETSVAQAFWDGWVEIAALMANRPTERVRQRLPEYYDLSELLASSFRRR